MESYCKKRGSLRVCQNSAHSIVADVFFWGGAGRDLSLFQPRGFNKGWLEDDPASNLGPGNLFRGCSSLLNFGGVYLFFVNHFASILVLYV